MGVYVGIEAGGTKFICAYGSGPCDLRGRVRIETGTPAETLPQLLAYLHKVNSQHEIDAIGLACFGPLELNKNSEAYGSITDTPKLSWRNFNIMQVLQSEFAVPIGFDTDVNAAALGEQRWGAGAGLLNVVYMTIGTGIGMGALVEGNLLHGAMHAEAGHMSIMQDVSRDDFAGVCPYHGNCLEGLASGPAIKKRWQVGSALDLLPDHAAWDLEAEYLAQAVKNVILCLSPEKIILGGGVMRQVAMLAKVREQTKKIVAGYIQNDACNDWQNYIVSPAFADDAGVVGALALAQGVNKTIKEYA